jgi:hypothetical protein
MLLRRGVSVIRSHFGDHYVDGLLEVNYPICFLYRAASAIQRSTPSLPIRIEWPRFERQIIWPHLAAVCVARRRRSLRLFTLHTLPLSFPVIHSIAWRTPCRKRFQPFLAFESLFHFSANPRSITDFTVELCFSLACFARDGSGGTAVFFVVCQLIGNPKSASRRWFICNGSRASAGPTPTVCCNDRATSAVVALSTDSTQFHIFTH